MKSMSAIIALLSSVMFVGGLVIASRQLSATAQLVVGIVMMVLALLLTIK